MTALKAIRAKCLDCMCDQQAEVKRCPCMDCPLYPYRMGHNPNRAGLGKTANLTKKAHSIEDSEHETISEDRYSSEEEVRESDD